MIYLGIDPGKTGGITKMETSPDGEVRFLSVLMMPATEQAIAVIFALDLLHEALVSTEVGNKRIKCLIEGVHSFPGQGVKSMFTFGQNYGFLRGCLVSLGIPFEEVTPQKWMGYFGLKRQKNEEKRAYKQRILQKAQNLYPHSSVALQTADSLMIAEYLRRTHNERLMP